MVKKPVIPLVLLACSMALAACDTTPPAVSALMSQVAAACQAGSKDALRACFAREGVAPYQIDQQVGGFDAYLDKGAGGFNWTYSSIEYVSLAAAANNKSFLPETIAMAQPTTISGIKFAPNIKVIGFIQVWFKQADGTKASEIEPVGIASDGTAKFALVEPQH